MKEFDLASHVHAELPWSTSTRGRGNQSDGRDSLRYKGWTLVDYGGWRWASKGKQRIRICRDHGVEHAEAMKEFHRKVDEHEG